MIPGCCPSWPGGSSRSQGTRPGRALGADLDPGPGCSWRACPAGCGRSPDCEGAGCGALGPDRDVHRGPLRRPDRPRRRSRRSAVTRGNDLSFRPGQPVYRGRLGHRRRSGPVRSGVCARGAAGPAAVRAAHGPPRGVAPCPVARAPRAGCCPAGSAGCLPPPRVRGGRIKVIVAWRRARRLGRFCRRHQPPPGDAGQMPRCPGLAPSRIRRWCAHRVPVDARDRVRAGTIPGPAPDDRPAPPSRAAGRGHDTGAAVTCAFTAMAGIRRDCPGHPRRCRHGLAGLALAGCQCPCGQPLVPTGLRACPDFFESYCSSWSPVTESNRRPSPYHACQFRPMPSHTVGLPQFIGISASGSVALCRP